MPLIVSDAYGHQTPSSLGVSAPYTGQAAGTAPGTIVAGGTIVTAAPAAINANDVGGNFTVVNLTAAAGVAASVFFAQPYPALLKSVEVSCYDQTAAAVLASGWFPVAAGSQAGFQIIIAAPAAITHTLFISYNVQP